MWRPIILARLLPFDVLLQTWIGADVVWLSKLPPINYIPGIRNCVVGFRSGFANLKVAAIDVRSQVYSTMNDLSDTHDLRLSLPAFSVDIVDRAAIDLPPARAPGLSWQSGLPLRMAGRLPAPTDRPTPIQAAVKRNFDILVSLLALIALAPLLIIVAIAIRATSPGSVLFSQEREGLAGRTFKALKFRSMRSDACDPSGVAQTVDGDPRVTAIGRFIRRTSIDELPQLINVLRGDMSLVGPRPHVPGMWAGGVLYRDLVPYYDYRLQVMPGLTGWAQANGLRGPTDAAEVARARVNHDVAYIQNYSFWLDVKIMWMTIRHEFVGGSGN